MQTECDEALNRVAEKYGSLREWRKAVKQLHDHVAAAKLARYTNIYRRKDAMWSRIAELKSKAYRGKAIMELSARTPSLGNNADATVVTKVVSANAGEEVYSYMAARIRDQTATHLDREHCSSTWRKHRIWKEDLAKQVGNVVRKTTNPSLIILIRQPSNDPQGVNRRAVRGYTW